MNRLDRAYNMIPAVNCKGLCQKSCGPVIPSFAEETRIRERHGVAIDYKKPSLQCTLLKDGKCSIYPDRPLLCRLFGAVEKMRCPFGCVPENGVMNRRDETRAWELIYGRNTSEAPK